MGTRADFYVGKGRDAEWIGSIAWDGYRDGIAGYILKAKTEAVFRKAVQVFLEKRKDATLPKDGWPWPWKDSATTDCSYWFFGGKCWQAIGAYMADGSCSESDVYLPCDVPESEFTDADGCILQEVISKLQAVEYPDMSALEKVTLGPRSGLIVITDP